MRILYLMPKIRSATLSDGSADPTLNNVFFPITCHVMGFPHGWNCSEVTDSSGKIYLIEPDMLSVHGLPITIASALLWLHNR